MRICTPALAVSLYHPLYMIPESLCSEMLRARSLLSSLDPASLYLLNTSDPTHRPSLHSSAFNHLKSFCGFDPYTMDPPSSDEDEVEGRGIPSVRRVVESVLDSQLCEVAEQWDSQWIWHDPAIVLLSVNARMTVADVMGKVRGLCSAVRKVQVADFCTAAGLRRCAIVYVQRKTEASRLFEELKEMETEGSLSAWVHSARGIDRSVRVKWFRNCVKDRRNSWAGVIFRNLDRDCSIEQLRIYLSEHRFSFLRIEPPRRVNSCKVALVITQDLATAERICAVLHKAVADGNVLKVHVHPDSLGRDSVPAKARDTGKLCSKFDVFDLIRGASPRNSLLAALEENPLKRLIRDVDPRPFS